MKEYANEDKTYQAYIYYETGLRKNKMCKITTIEKRLVIKDKLTRVPEKL